MTTGLVSATALNLRSAPGGAAIGLLHLNETVTITGAGQNGWLPIAATQDGKALAGWVSGAYVSQAAFAVPIPRAAAPTMAKPSAVVPGTAVPGTAVPPPDTLTSLVRLDGRKAIGPDGSPFASQQSSGGFFTSGATDIARWSAGQAALPGLTTSMLRVLEAVEKNEAFFEGVNSYDDAYLSFGFQQWTLGPGNAAGELPGLLAAVQASDPDAFADCFGRYNLSVKMNGPKTGFFTLNGAVVATGSDKQAFRKIEWAYRFWRAGHHPSVRRCEVSLAAARIALARAGAIRNIPVSGWLTSEHGVALLLDEHVNRPAHVPGTLASAVTAMIGAGAPADPATWTGAQEDELIGRYEQARLATSMTDPAGRARNIAQAVIAGQLSSARDSFIA